ncbi:MAG: hypothetical protein KGJ30_08845 [Burkholderiales bacterium]|nr:hypothetical protein [Burkholderiales bacterium]
MLLGALARGALAAAPTLECADARAATPDETALLAEINRARTAPAAYARVLARRLDALQADGTFVADGRRGGTLEGRPAIEKAVAALTAQAPLPALAGSACLSDAAREHVAEQRPAGGSGHLGRDGSHPSDRATRHLSGTAYCGEDLGYGFRDPAEIVALLLIDDGVPSRGHRANLLNRDFRSVGLAIGPHAVDGWMADILLCLDEVRLR